MRTIKSFDEFIDEGIVRKITPDNERSESLKSEADRKFGLLNENIKKNGVDNNNANDYVEYCYNIIMFLIRAEMFKSGYSSSGQGSHEAEVAFTKNLGFNDTDIRFLDQLRYFRNGILYYGKRFDKEYAEKVIEFTKITYKKLKETF